MRILVSSQTYAPAANGQSVFATQLTQGLSRQGHQVTVALPAREQQNNPATTPGLTIETFPSIHLLGLNEAYFTPFPYPGLRRLFDRTEPDIVHLQDHYPISRWIHFESSRRKLPIIATNHFIPENIIHYLNPLGWGKELMMKFLWWSMSSLYNRVNLVTTPTQTAAAIIRSHGLITPTEAISCGVDLNEYQPRPSLDPSLVRRRFDLTDEVPIYLYVGRVDREKGLTKLVHAVAKFQQPLRLVIAGTGHHLKTLKDLASELGLGKRVSFTGFVAEPDLKALLQIADVFVMPSPSELQSISTLEAMALGKPILAARARALPELVESGVNGYLFKPNSIDGLVEALRWSLDRKDEWPVMGRASQRLVQKHDISHTIRAYIELYRRVREDHNGSLTRRRKAPFERPAKKGIGP